MVRVQRSLEVIREDVGIWRDWWDLACDRGDILDYHPFEQRSRPIKSYSEVTKPLRVGEYKKLKKELRVQSSQIKNWQILTNEHKRAKPIANVAWTFHLVKYGRQPWEELNDNMQAAYDKLKVFRLEFWPAGSSIHSVRHAQVIDISKAWLVWSHTSASVALVFLNLFFWINGFLAFGLGRRGCTYGTVISRT